MNAPAPAQGGTIPPGYREVRLTGEPLVSLVVVADRGLPLARLAAECGGRGVELIAVHGGDLPDAGEGVERAFPGVRFVEAPGVRSLAALRERGLAAAEGDIVLFASGEEAAEPGWLDERLGRWSTRSEIPMRGGAEPSAVLATASTRSDE